MKRVIILFLLLFPIAASSQEQLSYSGMSDFGFFIRDNNGRLFAAKTNYELEGSPYYKEDFCIANIKVLRGKRYKGLPVKLNLEENRVSYQLPDGKEWISSVQIEFIEFSSCGENGRPVVFRSGFPAIDKQTEASYYEVLDSGQVHLLKFYKVIFNDRKSYGSAAVIRKYESSAVYYAYTPGKEMIALGKGNQHTTQVLSDKKEPVQKFIAEQGTSVKKESDLVKLFGFYNTLR